MKISTRASLTPPSPIRKLAPLANKAKADGVHLFHINIGQPDLASPPEFFKAIGEYPNKTITYEDSFGFIGLRKAWCQYMSESANVNWLTEDQILITTGASEALVFLFMTLCDPEDEVVVFDPTYANYIGFAAIAGVTLVPVMTEASSNFALPDSGIISQRISHRTRAILLCNPNNPTGTVYSKEDLLRLKALCKERDIYLVVDETYREFTFDGKKCESVLAVTKEDQRVIIVDSLSKRFSLCGSRIGCVATANHAVLTAMLAVAQARLCAPSIGQHAAAKFFGLRPHEFVESAKAEFQKRRDALLGRLEMIPGVTPYWPQGAFYALVGLPVENSEDFAAFMLSDFRGNNQSVFLASAAGFYIDATRGASQVRVAFVLESEKLVRAAELIEEGLAAYRRA